MVELDNAQRRAVESEAKTILMSGGPGTGKTHLLTLRFAHLTKSEGVPLSSMLVFTFSSASAARLRRRIEEIIQQSYDELWIHTYHSFSNFVLAEYASLAGSLCLPLPATPFREYLVIKELLRGEGPRFRSKLRSIAFKDGLAREISDFFGLLKQNLVRPEYFGETTENLTSELSEMARIYRVHEKYMRDKNWVGLRDAVPRALEILEAEPRLLGQYRTKFSHILVDEFQETDPVQLRLLKLLASEHTSLFVTGDEKQRIYRFRGSAVGQFSDITETRQEVEIFKLEKNYRLPAMLLRASRNLIAHSRAAERETIPVELGGELSVTGHKDAIEQAYAVARDIKRRVLDSAASSPPISYSDFAVICRSTSRSALALQEAFSYCAIPYVLYNCISFYKHPMVRFMADFVRLLVNPDDDRILLRVMAVPAFHLDAVSLRRLADNKTEVGTGSLYEAVRRTFQGGLATGLDIPDEETARALREFVCYFEETRKKASNMDCPSALIHSIMSKLFYGEILGKQDTAAGIRDAQNLRLLCEVVADIEQVFTEMRGGCELSDIAEYMEHAFSHFSSQQENDPADEPADGVRIMTAHQAKGMEFPFVFLIDATDEYFPVFSRGSFLLDGKSLEELPAALRKNAKEGNPLAGNLQFLMNSQEQLKEERQLFYVAASRASRHLTVCFTEESHLSGPVNPSPFIEELTGAETEAAPRERHGSGNILDARGLLASSFNRQEIESALRMCVRGLPPTTEDADELVLFLESLGLDAHFICAESPFEREPRQPPDLAGHRYSASQLATYLACPRRFFFEKILKIAPERPEDFGLGQLIHLVLERFHKKVKKFEGNRATLEASLTKAFRNIWKGSRRGTESSQKDAFCTRFPTALQRATVERRAEDILRRYIKTEVAQVGRKEIIACEKFVEFPVRNYLFSARIDRIDASSEGNHIIDYKTSGSGPKSARTIKKKFLNVDRNADYTPEDFQLPLYLLAGRNEGYNPVELSYYWLAQEDSSGMFRKSSLHVCDGGPDCLSDGDMQAAEDGIVAIVNQIAAGDFDPKPRASFECKWCSFEFICNAEEEDTTQNDR